MPTMNPDGGDLSGGPGEQGGSQDYVDPNPPPPPPPPPDQSYYHRSGRSAGSASAPDLWAGIPAYVHDQSTAWADQFAKVAGWPQFPDWSNLALQLAKNLTSQPGAWGAYDAFEWLWNNALDATWRTSNPWARYGMDKDSYTQLVGKFNSVMADWTGDVLNADQIHSAIRGSWTPDQIHNLAMFGNPEGTGALLESATFNGENPWLSAGQSYKQTLQGYQSFEGHAPTDKATLAAYFRFSQQARQIGGSQGARETAAQKTQTAEVR